MIYKTNTQNYASKNVNNFSDFIDSIESEKSELKDIKRSINPNTNDTQKYPKNSKFKFNKVTRKMDDLSLDETEDKIEESNHSKKSDLKIYQSELNMLNKVKATDDKSKKRKDFLEKEIDKIKSELELVSISESKDNLIASMKRFLEDYATNHTAFEKRGMDEGIEILRNSNSVEEGILNINKKIDELTKKEKEFMPQDQKEDMIKGLKDLVKNLESKSISESHIDDDMFLKLTNKPSYKKLISDMRTAIDEYLNTIEDTGFDEGDNDHYLSLSAAVTEACNTALEL